MDPVTGERTLSQFYLRDVVTHRLLANGEEHPGFHYFKKPKEKVKRQEILVF